MSALAEINWQEISVWVAFALTLMVYSYILGDNPLFRLAEHLLVGTAAGYAVVVAYHGILRPRLFEPFLSEPATQWYLVVPLLLGLLLLTKSRRSIAWLGNTSVGFLFGVGAALAMGGALLGSLAPQIGATWLSLNPVHYLDSGWGGVINAALIVLGATGALLFFYYNAPAGHGVGRFWAGVRAGWGRLGRWFILVALGAIFANTMIARLSLLIGRLRFLLNTLGF